MILEQMEAISKPIPHLHDAELLAICHDPASGKIECTFRKVDAHDVTLSLTGIEKFRCSDFGLQNVVLELVVAGGTQQLKPEELRAHIRWISGTSDGEVLATSSEIDCAVQNVLDGKWLLVFLIPSWGAQLGALVNGLNWR
jgi:hypothetical protein